MSMLRDATTIARRNMIRIRRVPDVMVFVVVQPLMFVLLFAYVFGGSIDIPGGSYREFLIAGIFAQTVVFGATFTGSGLAEDMQKGLINRFRSLPMRAAAAVRRAATGRRLRAPAARRAVRAGRAAAGCRAGGAAARSCPSPAAPRGAAMAPHRAPGVSATARRTRPAPLGPPPRRSSTASSAQRAAPLG